METKNNTNYNACFAQRHIQNSICYKLIISLLLLINALMLMVLQIWLENKLLKVIVWFVRKLSSVNKVQSNICLILDTADWIQIIFQNMKSFICGKLNNHQKKKLNLNILNKIMKTNINNFKTLKNRLFKLYKEKDFKESN